MYIVASIEHSLYLELALTDLKQKGIAEEKILAVPLERRVQGRKIFDTIHRSDGLSLFDGAAVLGTVFMVLGVIYGFVWKWGPVLWGLIGLFFGVALGFLLDFFVGRTRPGKKKVAENATEVVLIINCNKNQVEVVEGVLWDHFALGVARLDRTGR